MQSAGGGQLQTEGVLSVQIDTLMLWTRKSGTMTSP